MLKKRCRKPSCTNMYVRIDHGCSSNSAGVNARYGFSPPKASRKTKTTPLAINSFRTHGVSMEPNEPKEPDEYDGYAMDAAATDGIDSPLRRTPPLHGRFLASSYADAAAPPPLTCRSTTRASPRPNPGTRAISSSVADRRARTEPKCSNSARCLAVPTPGMLASSDW